MIFVSQSSFIVIDSLSVLPDHLNIPNDPFSNLIPLVQILSAPSVLLTFQNSLHFP